MIRSGRCDQVRALETIVPVTMNFAIERMDIVDIPLFFLMHTGSPSGKVNIYSFTWISLTSLVTELPS